MNILLTICGRGGSKGIPGKNTKLIAGKPLMEYSIDTARKFAEGRDLTIGISTDSDEILKVARECGIVTGYKRPPEMATDNAGKLVAIIDLLKYEENKRDRKFDYLIDLDITSPLRTKEDISRALQMLVDNEQALNIFSVNPANRNPYFNMVEENDRGYCELCKKGTFLTRQSAPKVYDMNASFYIYRRAFFDSGIMTAITDRSLIYEMPHICFDLDHAIDFEFMAFLLENRKLEFSI